MTSRGIVISALFPGLKGWKELFFCACCTTDSGATRPLLQFIRGALRGPEYITLVFWEPKRELQLRWPGMRRWLFGGICVGACSAFFIWNRISMKIGISIFEALKTPRRPGIHTRTIHVIVHLGRLWTEFGNTFWRIYEDVKSAAGLKAGLGGGGAWELFVRFFCALLLWSCKRCARIPS